ncbi:MAG: TMEM175 family protein [bacterium]
MRLLFMRGAAPGRTRAPFRWRGDGVSRIEGLSDAVFGFAITLVAVSLEVPRTAVELLHNAVGFVPFVASFLVLFFVWRAQFEFFRRYGLEDEATIWLTGMLLVFVLSLIYPLKFLLNVFTDAVVAGDVAKDRLRLEQFPAVLALYAGSLTGIALSFTLLYRHAFRLGARLELTELETFETRSMQHRWLRFAVIGGMMLLWCVVLISLGEHLRARDGVFKAVSQGGTLVIVVACLSQVIARRRRSRHRDALVARLDTEAPLAAERTD